MNIENLNAEQRTKVQGCQTPEEILALAKEAGYELTDEELSQINGGAHEWAEFKCPRCGSTDLDKGPKGGTCNNCGYEWH